MKYVPPFGATSPDQSYTNGIPGQIKGSPLDCKAIEHPLREIVHVIQQADIEPDSADLTQLYQAIVAIVAQMLPVDDRTFPKAFVGLMIDWESTVLPPDCCWPNGDFIGFGDWPEMAEKYFNGGFAGMLLAYDASAETIAANLGKWRPNAASPTGLFTPDRGDQFARVWVPGLSRGAGSWQADAMRPITGSIVSYNNGRAAVLTGYNAVEDYIVASGAFQRSLLSGQPQGNGSDSSDGGYDLYLDSGQLGANFSGTDTHPSNISQPAILYLGKPA
jgi:hypothetical protein